MTDYWSENMEEGPQPGNEYPLKLRKDRPLTREEVIKAIDKIIVAPFTNQQLKKELKII